MTHSNRQRAQAGSEDGESADGPDCDESPTETDDDRFVDDHLRDVEPGAGCTEIWEYLSDRRDE